MVGRTIYGDGRADTLRGAAFDDTIYGGGAEASPNDLGDAIHGGSGNDILFGNGGDDRLFGERGNDAVYGGAGNDSASGGLGNDTVHGNEGSDVLRGEDGDDVLYGGSVQADPLDSADSIYGGAGNDLIAGGLGADALYGGGGADTFRFGQTLTRRFDAIDQGTRTTVELDSAVLFGNTGDSIFEFEASDRIDLSDIDADARGWLEVNYSVNDRFNYIGAADFTDVGQVRVSRLQGDTVVEANTAPGLAAELRIVLVGYTGPVGPENIFF